MSFAKEEKGYLTFPTKFDMVDPILKLDHKGRVIIRMSVNPEEIIRKMRFLFNSSLNMFMFLPPIPYRVLFMSLLLEKIIKSVKIKKVLLYIGENTLIFMYHLKLVNLKTVM